MKRVIILLAAMLATVSCLKSESDSAHTLSPLEEKILFLNLEKSNSRDLIRWNECRGNPEAEYIGHRCSDERVISQTLLSFLKVQFKGCVNQALRYIGEDRSKSITIIHKGIMADARHSPQSMHAFGRAIDIHSIEVKFGWFSKSTFNFPEEGDSDFFREFRNCWGDVIRNEASCPFYEDTPEETGSIGKEDEDHQNHLHLSVPICEQGFYKEELFKR